jgi:hypothetical protein
VASICARNIVLQVLVELLHVAAPIMPATYVASLAQVRAVSSLKGLNVFKYAIREVPPLGIQLFVMIFWPLVFFQNPMVKAPVFVLQTVTVTRLDDDPPVICAVLLYEVHVPGFELVSVMEYVKTPHDGEARLVTPQPGLMLTVVPETRTVTVPRFAVHPPGLALSCTLSVIVNAGKLYGNIPLAELWGVWAAVPSHDAVPVFTPLTAVGFVEKVHV